MDIINTCRPKEHWIQGYPPVVPTAECRLCREKVRLTPIEALTNRAALKSGSYVCPLCRRLMAEAESCVPHDLDLSSLFPSDETVSFSTLAMNEMEDQYDDRYEEKSDSDKAADDECEGFGSMCPPSDEGPDAEECGDDELPLEADLWLQVHVHLTIRRNRQTR